MFAVDASDTSSDGMLFERDRNGCLSNSQSGFFERPRLVKQYRIAFSIRRNVPNLVDELAVVALEPAIWEGGGSCKKNKNIDIFINFFLFMKLFMESI